MAANKEKQEGPRCSLTQELWASFDQALKDRQDWDTEQADYYTMRYQGLGRPKLPYPNAPDMHYALIDEYIEKLKPFYVQQIYTPSTLATFIGYPDDGSQDTDAEAKFDYELKQHSNFELEIQRAIDKMLQCGIGLMKNYWDPEEKCLYFCSIDPNFVIVPTGTEGLQDADFFIHVIHMSEAAYRRNKDFKQDDDFIKEIKGRGNTANSSASNMENLTRLKNQREGITYHATDSIIVLWECYTRREGGKGWRFDTVSPILGWEHGAVRDTQTVPYDHNELPFTEYRLELAEPGFYSSRGIAALLKAHELSLDKLWNYLFQYLDFSAMPTFDNDGTSVTNSTNLQKEPGLILPPGITQSETVKAPVEFMEQMQTFRAMAEARIQVPDLSASEHLSGQRGARGDVTATQISAIVGQSNQGNDMRSRIWKLQVAPGFRQSWSLLTQYKYTEYKARKYNIQPSGSADSWDKAARAAQAMSLYQLLVQDQNIDPQGRTKYLLESNGPELVKKLFKPQSPPAPPPPTPLEQVEAMSKLLTAMSNVTRVGVPLTRDDYSSVLKTIGLPPLPPGPAAHVGDTPGGPPAPHIVQHAEAGARHKLDAAKMLADATDSGDGGDNPLAQHLLDRAGAMQDHSHDMELADLEHQHAMEQGAQAGEQAQRTAMAKGGVVSGKGTSSQSGKSTSSGKSSSKSSDGGGVHIHLPESITHKIETPPEPEPLDFSKMPAPQVTVRPVVNVSPPHVTVNVPKDDRAISIDHIERDDKGHIKSAKVTRK